VRDKGFVGHGSVPRRVTREASALAGVLAFRRLIGFGKAM
jgi:hypothetical protein